jgi:DNA replication protein DnaC
MSVCAICGGVGLVRIGDRMRSRLAEMCIRVDMKGKDFRQAVKCARFG